MRPKLLRELYRMRSSFLAMALFASVLTLLYGCWSNYAVIPAQTPSVAATEKTRGDQLYLALPIDCTLGQDCFILHYPDRDPGPQSVDFGCGRLTYNGHDGTDFAIPDERAMAVGIAVKAAAPGKVLAVRNEVSDRRIETEKDRTAVSGIECGNGVLLDHGDGWQTQYCHLRQGSVAVKPGTLVETGTVLGLVGESGLASFPHVHLTVRHQGTAVDPFVGPSAKSGCDVARHSLWAKPVAYVPTGLVRAGFANQPPKLSDVWQGRFWETGLPLDSPALIFWVQAYGVLQGDVEQFRVVAPDGRVVVDQKRDLKEPNRVWLSYVGKQATRAQPFLPGVWQGEYRLVRQGQVLIDLNRKVQLR